VDHDHLRTAQALQRITDRGKFELLVGDILWVSEPRYRNLITTGVNANGESIRGIVDGLARVPRTTPPEFLLLAATTTSVRYLASKFRDDLRKVSGLAESLRATTGTALVTMIFATNELVSVELFKLMNAETADKNLELDVWDQRKLSRVLDLVPEGQWLRRDYLGIEASILSPKLLHRLSSESTAAYASSLLTDPRKLSERPRVADIVKALGNGDTTLLAITGESGYGKSTAALHALTRRVQMGDTALWLTADHVAAASSIGVLLTNVLTELNGSRIEDPLAFFRRSWTGARGRLLLTVDDLNRADAGPALIRKVYQWATMVSKARDSMPPITFIVPLWPGIHAAAASDYDRASWLEAIEVFRFTRSETIEVLSAIGIPATVIDAVADELGDDPFLVGRFRAVAADRPTQADYVALAKTVLETHLADIERDLAEATPLADSAFVHQTLIALARNEIAHASLQPTLQEVRAWLPNAHQVLDTALRSGRLLVRRYAKAGDEIQFRHDRLHDQLLGAAMAEIIDEGQNHDAVADPFFARITGVALTTIDDESVDRVAKEAPLAVFEALRVFGYRATPRRQRLFEIAVRWVEQEAASVPSQVRYHVLSALFDADSNLVLPLTEAFSDSWLRRLVRLRAGDAASGAAFCGDSNSSFIFSDPRVEHATEQAMTFHREMLVSGTTELLRGASNDRLRYGALTLAGWTGAPELARDAFTCWQTSEDRDAVVSAAMWAAIRCAKGDDVGVFSPLLDQILQPEPEGKKTRRHGVFYAAGSYGRFASTDAIQALDREARKDPLRARIVLALLEYADDPIVLNLFLRVVEARTGTGFDLLTTRLHMDLSSNSTRRRRPLGPASRKVLEDAWKDEALSQTVRWEAFGLWSKSADDEDLKTLRTFDKVSPFHESAIRARAGLGDQTVAAELAEHITRSDYRGIYELDSAAQVWSSELYAATDILLRRVEDHMEQREDCGCDVHGLISDLLVKIPSCDSERLLVEHWPALGRNGTFIQVALFIGTEQLVTLATAAIRSRPDDPELFKYVSLRFLAFHADEDGTLTPEHLNRLLPFASRIPWDALSKIIADAARRGWRQWIIEHFETATAHMPEKDRDGPRKQYFPETKELSVEFRSKVLHANQWLHDLDQRAIPIKQIVDAALLAVVESVDDVTWIAACEVLDQLGARSDITRFEPYVPETSDARAAFAGAAFEVRYRTLR
jgi:hypothetical protein